MNYAAHLEALKATKADKEKRQGAIVEASVTEKRSMNAGEQEEFDTITDEIKALDSDLGRIQVLADREAADKASAKPIDANGKEKALAGTQPLRAELNLKTVEKLEPGIAFARYGMCLFAAKGDHAKAFQLAQKHYPQTESIVKTLKAQSEGANLQEMMRLKTSIAAGTTTDSTWAAPLVYANTFGGDFIEFLRAQTLVGRASFRRVPFNVRIAGQNGGTTGYWVGQGKAKPVSKASFNATTVPFTKIAGIAVLTQELIRFSDPSAERLVRDDLARAVTERADSDLFDPDVAAQANVNPAGLLNGVAPVAGPPASGVDADEIRCALLRLWAPWDSTYMGSRPAYFTTPAVARFLAFTRDTMGNPAFPGVTPTGGMLDGVPIFTSQYLANNGGSGGSPLILVDQDEIFLADDGNVTVDFSTEASIEMTDAPTAASGVPTAGSVNTVSMFQTNSVALRAERFIWWGPRRTGAVQWIDGFPTSC
jgi:HK97 family phage major capsid protein